MEQLFISNKLQQVVDVGDGDWIGVNLDSDAVVWIELWLLVVVVVVREGSAAAPAIVISGRY